MKYVRTDSFKADYQRLSAAEKGLFRQAVRDVNHGCDEFVRTRDPSVCPASLRVKTVHGAPGVWEMAWSPSGPDGRATWEWAGLAGDEGAQPAIRWRRTERSIDVARGTVLGVQTADDVPFVRAGTAPGSDLGTTPSICAFGIPVASVTAAAAISATPRGHRAHRGPVPPPPAVAARCAGDRVLRRRQPQPHRQGAGLSPLH